MLNGKRVLAVVPARGGSKGVPRKNVKELSGKPLIAYTARVVEQCEWIDTSVISTDDDEIASISESYGLLAPFRRPDSLAGDRIGDWDVLDHALRIMEDLKGMRYDAILMLQPTSPFRTPELVRKAAEKLITESFDSVWSVNGVDLKFHPLKQLVVDESGNMSHFDERGKRIIARQQLSPTWVRNGLVYAFTRDCLLEQKSILGRRAGLVEVDFPYVNIDTIEDFQDAERLMAGGSGKR